MRHTRVAMIGAVAEGEVGCKAVEDLNIRGGYIMAVQATNLQFDYSKYGFRDEEHYVFKSGKGLNEGVVRELSGMKGEPDWMLKRRLQALEIFKKKPVPLKGMWANQKLAQLY